MVENEPDYLREVSPDDAVQQTEFMPRVPPSNLDIEKSFLGSILLHNSIYEDAAEILRPQHFASQTYGEIFEIIGKIINRGDIADGWTLRTFFEENRKLQSIGGDAFLAEIASAAMNKKTALGYAKVIVELYQKRELILFGEDVAVRGYSSEPDDTAKAVLEFADKRLFELSEPGRVPEQSRDAGINDSMRLTEQRYQDPDSLSGVTTGLEKLDNELLGLQRQDLIVLAAASSMGKTTLAQKFAKGSADAGVPADLFSMEMPASQIWQRIVSDKANVPLNFIRSGRYHDDEQAHRVFETYNELKRSFPVDVISGVRSVPEIRSVVRRSIKSVGTGLVIVDQLSHVRDTSGYTQRNHQYGALTKSLKAMAMELKIPVVLLHQINRGVASREDKRPNLSDLRDSGEIEQDADVVLFLYREHYYLKKAEPQQQDRESTDDFSIRYAKWQARLEAKKYSAEIDIAKQRMGPTSTVHVHYNGAYSRFGTQDTTEKDFDL